MKVSKGELEALRAAVAPLDTDDNRARYLSGDFPRADAVRDLDARYRWDLFYAARGWAVLSGEYDNTHIATALRAVVSPLNGEGQGR